jgi:hypothetical protein
MNLKAPASRRTNLHIAHPTYTNSPFLTLLYLSHIAHHSSLGYLRWQQCNRGSQAVILYSSPGKKTEAPTGRAMREAVLIVIVGKRAGGFHRQKSFVEERAHHGFSKLGKPLASRGFR